MGSKKSHNGIYALVGIIIVAAIFFGPMGGKFPAASVSTSDNSGGVSFGSNSGSNTGTGLKQGDQVTVTLNHRDALTEASLTEATNVKTTLLTKRSDGGFTVVTTGSGQTYTVGDDGKIWLSFETQASGQSYFWAKDRTFNANPGLFNAGDAIYTDIEGDGTKEWVVSVSTSGLESQKALSGTKPDRALNVKWFNENTVTLSAPADQTSVGQTTVAKYVTYTVTGTAGDATALSRIQVVFNSTSDSKWDVANSYVKVMNTGETIPLSSFTKTQDGTNTIYEYLYGYTLDKARVLEFANGGSGTLTLEEKFTFTLADSDQIGVTLKLDSVNEVDGANSQVTDTVGFQE